MRIMKKVIFFALALFTTSAVLAQTKGLVLDPVDVEGEYIKPLHLEYFTKVQDQIISKSVLGLEHRAASFDVLNSKLFNKRGLITIVDFSSSNGFITATYAKDGTLESTNERFKNVPFTIAVRNQLYRAYPGWKVTKNRYLVSYDNNGMLQRDFKVWLTKGGERIQIKISANGDGIAMVAKK